MSALPLPRGVGRGAVTWLLARCLPVSARVRWDAQPVVTNPSAREEVERLLRESEALEDRLATWQTAEPGPTPIEVRAARDEYVAWYHRAQEYLADEVRSEFVDYYVGGMFVQRIRAFLDEPLSPGLAWEPGAAPNPFINRWKHPFEDRFKRNVEAQRDLLRAALHARSQATTVLDELAAVFRRLPQFLESLRHADAATVPAPDVKHEADLQVLVEALLRLLYDDVRAEDPAPQRAGASSRVDFFLREPEVVIETKMTRAGLADRKVGEELAIDFERYRSHPGCRGVLALIYDPSRRIKNPRGLEHDLTKSDGPLATRVLVVN